RLLLPLPILSVLLLGTALASPGLLRMTVNVFDDANLTILASVQNVVHPSGPDGKLVGLMTVTNHASTDTRITVGTATIESLTYAQVKTCTISGTPLPSSVWTTTTACA